MYVALRPFLRLCLLNAGPQDLPALRGWFWTTLFLYFLVDWLLAMPGNGHLKGLGQSLLDTALLWVYTTLLLRLFRHTPRFMQTMTALAGSGAMIGTILLPLVYSMVYAQAQHAEVGITGVAYLVIAGWLVVVYGHIFRQALGLRLFAAGLLVSILYLVTTSIIMQLLFPNLV
ncbi:MAG: hypothetical protein P8Y64_01310 [Gammaproteobacteria bacterium]|jgi:hypothetical protein